MGIGGSKPNPSPSPSFESEMEGRSKRLWEMELDAARALAEMAKIEAGSEEGGKSSRKRIMKEARAKACGGRSHDLNISRSEVLFVCFLFFLVSICCFALVREEINVLEPYL